MITVTESKAQGVAYEAGTLLQSKQEFQGRRNIYLVLRDADVTEDTVKVVRLVSNGRAGMFDVFEGTLSVLEPFHGKLEIENA